MLDFRRFFIHGLQLAAYVCADRPEQSFVRRCGCVSATFAGGQLPNSSGVITAHKHFKHRIDAGFDRALRAANALQQTTDPNRTAAKRQSTFNG